MKKHFLLIAILLFNLISIYAQRSAVYIVDGKAIRGYDPVAYFTEGKPVKGDENLVYNWNNASWFFSSQQNLELFKKNPEKYAPQYGGYCAYGLSRGYKAKTVPEAWTIDNGKLYLNYSLGVRDDWNKNRQERIEKANSYWPQIKDKE
jgi:YHS domain-containing protein